jgi:hypothetical protein
MKVEEKKSRFKPTQEVFRLTLEELGFANHKPSQMTNSDYWMCTSTAMKNYANQFTPTTTTSTLQEGDWTKCEKFSEWVAILEAHGDKTFDSNDFYQYTENGGYFNFKVGGLYWGKGENLLPYQEFKSRAENTFKTK